MIRVEPNGRQGERARSGRGPAGPRKRVMRRRVRPGRHHTRSHHLLQLDRVAYKNEVKAAGSTERSCQDGGSNRKNEIHNLTAHSTVDVAKVASCSAGRCCFHSHTLPRAKGKEIAE